MTKNEIITAANSIANELNTIVEIKDYTELGWTSISFAIDRFGGTYVHINLNNETLKMVNWFGSEREEEVKDIENLKALVMNEKSREEKERDLNEVYNFINAEY